MNWNVVPIVTAIVVGFVGFCLMAVAFVMVARQGSWGRAMQSDDGRWSLPRRLMFAGAIFGAVFGFAWTILFLIPGGIPWPFVGTVLPVIAAVWYFIIRPAASHRHQTAGRQSEQSNARSDG
jgi:hypothetical protein